MKNINQSLKSYGFSNPMQSEIDKRQKHIKELKNKMNIKEHAESYTAPEAKNISEVDKIPVDTEIMERTFTREDGTEFKINLIVVNDEEYRIPTSVIKQLKEHLIAKPDIEHFSVSKSGEGMKTTYTVIPV